MGNREAYARNTPTWQFSVRPAVPEYCLWTPADRARTHTPAPGPAARHGRTGPRSARAAHPAQPRQDPSSCTQMPPAIS